MFFSIPFTLQRKISIQKSFKEVLGEVGDFSKWPQWSPWLILEPECSYRVEGTPLQPGHRQTWEGRGIGAGSQVLEAREGEGILRYQLDFLKPWKSRNQVVFSLTPQTPTSTEVQWSMEGSLPLWMFWMKRRLEAWVGGDYDRGLNLLKGFLETGRPPSRCEDRGIQQKAGFAYVGIQRSCGLKEMPGFMSSDFQKLKEWHAHSGFSAPLFSFSFYPRFDMVNQTCQYLSGLAFAQKPTGAFPFGFEQGEVPAHRVLQVDHRGAYSYLGNAWGRVMNRQRIAKEKDLKSISWYEVYRNRPGEVADSELLTEVCLPLR